MKENCSQSLVAFDMRRSYQYNLFNIDHITEFVDWFSNNLNFFSFREKKEINF